MAIEEKRFYRNGVPMPIQCLLIQKAASANPNAPMTLHYHDYFELLYGVSGQSLVQIGTERMSLGVGDLVLVQNGAVHAAEPQISGSSYIVIKFLPSVLFAEGHTLSEYSYTRLFLQNAEETAFFAASELTETPIPSLFPRLYAEWAAGEFGYELSLRADVTQVMLHLMRIRQKQGGAERLSPISTAKERLIRGALTYAETHYAEASEQECARTLGVSPPYLSRVFKSGMGVSFTAYVATLRLKEAEKLLVSTDAAITEIATRVGFSTAAYFTAAFRAHYEMTPSRYRKLLRGTK